MPNDDAAFSLAELFTELEQAQVPTDTAQSIVRRRVPTANPCDLLIGIQKPDNARTLIARFRTSALPTPYEFPEFKSLRLQIQYEMENGVEKTAVVLHTVQTSANDVFTSLVEDVCRVTASEVQEEQAAIAFQRRLLQWQLLLQKAGSSGLTEEEQQGLYGELYCLKQVILSCLQPIASVFSWTGPEATAKDFQFAQGVALEVKTTLAKEPQHITISSEKQLDDNGLNRLFLMNVSVERVQNAGETLPDLVESIKSVVAVDPAASSLLNEKLLTVGYADVYASRYKSTGYVLRKLRCFHVQQGFPRLVENNLPDGVGNVRYFVSVAACQPFYC